MTRAVNVFRRIADRNEWRSEDGRWLVEKSYGEGKRGGTVVRWHLYRVWDGRLHLVATEKRLRDLWSHVG